MNIYQINKIGGKFLNHNNNLIRDLRIYRDIIINSKIINIQNIYYNNILKILKKINMMMIITKKAKTIK